ncbi:hypothetical protein GYMLUDRAFT_45707 [Collybiopsis luxurians FD-317 M1]|uniref:Amino acid transporter n=1 Tax=Collybiopsis luxurians FD-317 M1 TaxID=944289 RepID=A0A0D0C5R2_9AGAR|nr:hypothetical protein GYMLUDRAFT_45707 [Collybiopsis luxurians FD-317 M1]
MTRKAPSVFSTNSKEHGIDGVAADQLNDLGYRPELRRSRSLRAILFMLFSTMAVPFTVSTTLYTGLIGGGAATMVWGHTLTAILSLPTALSLAELVSKFPTSAGTYYWTYHLAGPQRRALYSWINGWLFLVGMWTCSLSATFGTAGLIVAGVNILLPNWDATAWQTYFIFLATEVVVGICGVFLNEHLPTLEFIGSAWGILGTCITVVSLLIKAAAGRRSITFVFSNFNPSFSGWPSVWTFFIGLLPVIYTFSATGALLPMTEEVHNPTVNIPQATVWTVPVGYLQGLMYILAIFFTLPDTETLLQYEQPVAQVFRLVMGSPLGGFGLWFILFGVCIFCSIPVNVSASRATWSFARDKAIPLNNIVARVSSGHFGDLPLAALLLSLTIQSLLGLIYLGSTTAFNSFVGIGVMSLQASFAMPITLSLLNGRKELDGARFSLGRWGTTLNLASVLWIAVQIVILSMPVTLPVTASTMNYASVIFVGFALFSGGYYLLRGRFQFRGPPGLDRNEEARDDLSETTSLLADMRP